MTLRCLLLAFLQSPLNTNIFDLKPRYLPKSERYVFTEYTSSFGENLLAEVLGPFNRDLYACLAHSLHIFGGNKGPITSEERLIVASRARYTDYSKRPLLSLENYTYDVQDLPGKHRTLSEVKRRLCGIMQQVAEKTNVISWDSNKQEVFLPRGYGNNRSEIWLAMRPLGTKESTGFCELVPREVAERIVGAFNGIFTKLSLMIDIQLAVAKSRVDDRTAETYKKFKSILPSTEPIERGTMPEISQEVATKISKEQNKIFISTGRFH